MCDSRDDCSKHIVFITGGVRSGKSRFARQLVEQWHDPLVYIATAEVRDEEMRARVARHRQDRGPRWATVEMPLDLAAALDRTEGKGGVLLDCLTLWIANLMGRCCRDEARIASSVADFKEVIERFSGRLCIVSNEVGSDVIPANTLARTYRDLMGRLNQDTAARANEVFLMSSGFPVRLK